MSGEPVFGGKADPVTIENLATCGRGMVSGMRIFALMVSMTSTLFAGTVVSTSLDLEAPAFNVPLDRSLTIVLGKDFVTFLDAFLATVPLLDRNSMTSMMPPQILGVTVSDVAWQIA